MAKGKFKNVLATGLAITGAIQLGVSTPVNALGKPIKGGAYSEDSVRVSAEQARAEIEKRHNREFGTKLAWCKNETRGGFTMHDPHKEIHEDDAGRQFYRFTQDDGTPFTGLYKSMTVDGRGYEWYILDEDGFCARDPKKPHFVWVDGMLCADFVEFEKPNYNEADGLYYLGKLSWKDNTRIVKINMNAWQEDSGKWYRSNDKGVCFRNQWFKDEGTGNWYYFNDKCEMVTSTLVNGYWVDEKGICKM